MEQIELKAEIRTEIGKQKNKHLREKGLIPAVVYRQGKETVPLKIPAGEVNRVLHTEHGENVVIALTVTGDAKQKKERLVMIKEVQSEPIYGGILHVDFHEISLSEKLKVHVPVEPKGEPVGVKQDVGVLEHTLREVEVECLVTQIPNHLEVDVSQLQIGDSLHVRDLIAPEGVQILTDPELTIFTVKPPEKVEEVAPVEAEVAEPEVITERKAEAEGEEKEGKEKGKAEEGKKPAAEKKPAEEGKKKGEAKEG